MSVSGLATLLFTDRAMAGSGKNPPLGNVLVLLAACLYAVGNVAQESLLGRVATHLLLPCPAIPLLAQEKKGKKHIAYVVQDFSMKSLPLRC